MCKLEKLALETLKKILFEKISDETEKKKERAHIQW